MLFLPVIMNVSFSQNSMTDSRSTRVIFTFSIDIDPMERILLVNFEKDPDSVYVGFEPQVFNDEINGVGHRVIASNSYGQGKNDLCQVQPQTIDCNNKYGTRWRAGDFRTGNGTEDL